MIFLLLMLFDYGYLVNLFDYYLLLCFDLVYFVDDDLCVCVLFYVIGLLIVCLGVWVFYVVFLEEVVVVRTMLCLFGVIVYEVWGYYFVVNSWMLFVLWVVIRIG